MSAGRVTAVIDDRIATVRFDRPQSHNAMTWAMYDELAEICERLRSDRDIVAVVFRGAGGQAFVSGTDIGQLTDITDGDAGLAYEARIEACVGAIERLPKPTLALIDGWALGGGLALASACDVRLATAAARFGAPIARTVGNCLTLANTRRLIAGFGVAAAKRILMLGEIIAADEALKCGFVLDVVDADALERRAADLLGVLGTLAPLTLRASKEMIRRIVHEETAGGAADLIAEVYGSEDFRAGVRAFIDKTPPKWQGR